MGSNDSRRSGHHFDGDSLRCRPMLASANAGKPKKALKSRTLSLTRESCLTMKQDPSRVFKLRLGSPNPLMAIHAPPKNPLDIAYA